MSTPSRLRALVQRVRLQRDGDQGGFTTVELVVVVVIMAVFMFAVGTSIDSMMSASRTASDKTASLGDLRTAEEAISRDLRAANPINAVTPVSLYDTSVSFSVYCSNAGVGTCGANNLRNVTYSVQNNTLTAVVGSTTRTLVGPTGFGSLAASKRPGAVVNPTSEPIFTYYDKNGNALVTQGTTTTPATTFRDCTRTVQINLRVIADARTQATLNLITKVDLRNFNEVSGCPA